MTAKPLIGISGSHMIDGGGQFPGYHRSYVNHDYVRSVTEAGGIPLIIPFNEEDDVVEALMDRVDGLLLSGGHDVYPLLYGEEPCRQIGAVWPERDHFDMLLLKRAEARKIPVVGICRGLQIINVAHGGTLYQDLSKDPQSFVKHSQNQDPATGRIPLKSILKAGWLLFSAVRNGSRTAIITRPFTKWAKDSLLRPAPRMAPWNPCRVRGKAISWPISSIRK